MDKYILCAYSVLFQALGNTSEQDTQNPCSLVNVIISWQVSKFYSMLEDGKYHEEDEAAKETKYEVVGGAVINRVVKQDFTENCPDLGVGIG